MGEQPNHRQPLGKAEAVVRRQYGYGTASVLQAGLPSIWWLSTKRFPPLAPFGNPPPTGAAALKKTLISGRIAGRKTTADGNVPPHGT
jgi:hypothetical protein